MFDSNNSIIKHKTGLLNLAQALGMCLKPVRSRDTFYRYQRLVEEGM